MHVHCLSVQPEFLLVLTAQTCTWIFALVLFKCKYPFLFFLLVLPCYVPQYLVSLYSSLFWKGIFIFYFYTTFSLSFLKIVPLISIPPRSLLVFSLFWAQRQTLLPSCSKDKHSHNRITSGWREISHQICSIYKYNLLTYQRDLFFVFLLLRDPLFSVHIE